MRLIDADKLPYAMKDYFDGKKTIGQIIDDAPTVEMAEDCISREQALRHRHIIHDDDGIGYSVVRVDEIIDLPSVKPTVEMAEDCVSRENALNGLYATDLKGWQLAVAFEAIEKLPSVQPQPKTGQWIAEINDYGEVMGWHCDKCYEDSGFTTTCKWDFCPSCGTKMLEVSADE